MRLKFTLTSLCDFYVFFGSEKNIDHVLKLTFFFSNIKVKLGDILDAVSKLLQGFIADNSTIYLTQKHGVTRRDMFRLIWIRPVVKDSGLTVSNQIITTYIF